MSRIKSEYFQCIVRMTKTLYIAKFEAQVSHGGWDIEAKEHGEWLPILDSRSPSLASYFMLWHTFGTNITCLVFFQMEDWSLFHAPYTFTLEKFEPSQRMHTNCFWSWKTCCGEASPIPSSVMLLASAIIGALGSFHSNFIDVCHSTFDL